MTKEDGVPKYNEILFSHKKGNDAIYTNTGPRDYHPEWSKSEKQIPYDIAYTWNLKKKGKMSYLQTINRVTDIENNLIVTRGEGGG